MVAVAYSPDGQALLVGDKQGRLRKPSVVNFNGQKLQKYELVPVHGITKDNLAQFEAGCSY